MENIIFSEEEVKMIMLSGAYSSLGSTLQNSELLDERWTPLSPKDASYEDLELVKVMRVLEGVVLMEGVRKAEERAAVMGKILPLVGSIQDSMEGNHALFALHLLELALEKPTGASQMLLKSKCSTLIPSIGGRVEEVAGFSIKKNSFFIASNIQRRLKGEAVLTDQVASLRAANFKKRLSEAKQREAVNHAE